MTPKTLKRNLLKAMKDKLPILIKGAPGCGKSDIMAQVAEELGMELVLMHPVVSDPTDFKGLPGIVNDMAEFLPYGDLRKLMEADSPTIAFMDDLGQAPAVVQAAAMQLLLARCVNGHKISDHIVFAAATNRREDRAGVTGILEPVKSRFASIWQLDIDVEDWIEWALKNKLPAELIGFVHFRPALLSSGKATADIVNSPCPRTFAFAGKMIQAGLTDFECLAGTLGEGCASDLVGFLKIYKELPDIDDVIDNPNTAPVPENLATLYAIVSALVEYSTEKNASNIIKYGERIPEEFSVLLIRDLIRKNPKIQNTKSFINWAVNHQDVLL